MGAHIKKLTSFHIIFSGSFVFSFGRSLSWSVTANHEFLWYPISLYQGRYGCSFLPHLSPPPDPETSNPPFQAGCAQWSRSFAALLSTFIACHYCHRTRSGDQGDGRGETEEQLHSGGGETLNKLTHKGEKNHAIN